ncbi:hypothetical protein [Photobacterium galatheae]|uniref:Secretin N-terminal domain-containing protein n=1 Tax=Photobacterium galatheae TaxID=1654360 RepID=A0A066RQJ5_9GAMM|nr:hypothetical protein [Photobacterium galatheae]KDM89967.1 hypothetical protein EA58_19680 [Photobacterium galatheae]MCM0149238.1 hypothetical protein [Photobacterium galatheae]
MIFDKSKISILVTAAFASGCSQLHTQDFKEIKQSNIDATDEIDGLKGKTVAEINGGATLDEIFVKLTPVKIKTKDTINLPDFLPETIAVYSGVPMSESELGRVLYLDYGIKLSFSRMIVKEEEVAPPEEPSGNGTDQNIETMSDGAVSLMNLGSTGEIEQVSSSPGQSGQGSSDYDPSQDMLALFGNSREQDNSKDKRIQKIDYSGSLTGFFDWLALDRGLSWKYDDDTDTFILYDLDTVVFELIDNTDKFTLESTIDTSSNSDAGSSDGASSSKSSTSQKASFAEEANHWADVQSMVEQMLSPDGKAAFDLKNGRVAVTDTKNAIQKIGRVVDQINASSGSQVVLNLTFVKVSVEETSEIGMNLTATDLVAGAVTGGTKLGGDLSTFSNIFNLSFNKAGVTAMIGALGRLGSISYRFDTPILTMNNHLTPFQSVEEEHYIAEVEKETDENGNETLTPKKAVNKTGITSIWKNRIFKDRVLVDGKISLIENLNMKEVPDMNSIVLPKNALDAHNVKAMLRNGETRVVSIKEVNRKSAEASGPFGANSFILGGNEKTKHRREISIILATPYVLK